MRKRTFLLSITVAGIAGAAAFGWVTIRRGFSARDNPLRWRLISQRQARRLSIPASERDAKNPFATTADVLSEARVLSQAAEIVEDRDVRNRPVDLA